MKKQKGNLFQFKLKKGEIHIMHIEEEEIINDIIVCQLLFLEKHTTLITVFLCCDCL